MKRMTTAWIALIGGFVALAGAGSPSETMAMTVHDPTLRNVPLQFVSEPIALSIAGHPAVLRVIRADESPQPTLDAVAQAWRGSGALLRRDEEGPWSKLSRIDRHGIQTLQLRRSAGGGCDGYLVRWQLSARQPGTVLAHRLLPSSAVVLSDVASEGSAPGRTLVAWSPAGLADADRALQARAAGLGLRVRSDESRPDPDPARERSHHFSSEAAELAITLHLEGRGTALVIHQMERVP